jgi:hypothetical protein
LPNYNYVIDYRDPEKSFAQACPKKHFELSLMETHPVFGDPAHGRLLPEQGSISQEGVENNLNMLFLDMSRSVLSRFVIQVPGQIIEKVENAQAVKKELARLGNYPQGLTNNYVVSIVLGTAFKCYLISFLSKTLSTTLARKAEAMAEELDFSSKRSKYDTTLLSYNNSYFYISEVVYSIKFNGISLFENEPLFEIFESVVDANGQSQQRICALACNNSNLLRLIRIAKQDRTLNPEGATFFLSYLTFLFCNPDCQESKTAKDNFCALLVVKQTSQLQQALAYNFLDLQLSALSQGIPIDISQFNFNTKQTTLYYEELRIIRANLREAFFSNDNVSFREMILDRLENLVRELPEVLNNKKSFDGIKKNLNQIFTGPYLAAIANIISEIEVLKEKYPRNVEKYDVLLNVVQGVIFSRISEIDVVGIISSELRSHIEGLLRQANAVVANFQPQHSFFDYLKRSDLPSKEVMEECREVQHIYDKLESVMVNCTHYKIPPLLELATVLDGRASSTICSAPTAKQ